MDSFVKNEQEYVDYQTAHATQAAAEVAVASLKTPNDLTGGTKTVASASTPDKLVAASTPCKAVWIGARCDASGTPLNTGVCMIGSASIQNLPIVPANIEGILVPIDDASKIYVDVGVNGEGVAYQIYA